jgi:NTE family protein
MGDQERHRGHDAADSGAATPAKRVNLALQGGGAHGAFAWGVLDRLLEDEGIEIEGVSATSAGSMNAVVLAHGLASGGRQAARDALAEFWSRVSGAAQLSPLRATWWEQAIGDCSLRHNPAYWAFETMTRLLSPYQLNPINHHPLRAILAEHVDFERLRGACPIKLFLCATNVRTGKVRIFEPAELSVDAVLASGCLPFLFQAVEIDGEAYWDGGYMGNPAIFPLIYGCESPDVVVVHINPIERPDVPFDAQGILNRINEISFNSSLMREMRAIAFVTRLIEEGHVGGTKLKRMLIHSIEGEDVMRGLTVASKLNADWEFLMRLHGLGRARAETWLAANRERLGVESTVDVRAKYL